MTFRHKKASSRAGLLLPRRIREDVGTIVTKKTDSGSQRERPETMKQLKISF